MTEAEMQKIVVDRFKKHLRLYYEKAIPASFHMAAGLQSLCEDLGGYWKHTAEMEGVDTAGWKKAYDETTVYARELRGEREQPSFEPGGSA